MMKRMMKRYENIERARFEGVGDYDIPTLEKKTDFDSGVEFISFNYASSCKNRENKGIHFFVDDYQFIRLWNDPDRYMPMLQQFRYVLTPDFSLYTDFPKALQIWNHYRKHWIGAYMQMYGIDVIPTIAWSTPESFEWCFDGEPTNGIVAVSREEKGNTNIHDVSRTTTTYDRARKRRMSNFDSWFYGSKSK